MWLLINNVHGNKTIISSSIEHANSLDLPTAITFGGNHIASIVNAVDYQYVTTSIRFSIMAKISTSFLFRCHVCWGSQEYL